jgi:hypothetical protein
MISGTCITPKLLQEQYDPRVSEGLLGGIPSNTVKKSEPMKNLFAKIEVSLFLLILIAIQLIARSNSINSLRDVLASWTLNTGDTRLTVGVNSANNLYIYEIRNPTENWNWTQSPSPFPLLSSVSMGGTVYSPNWVYQSGTMDTSDGTGINVRLNGIYNSELMLIENLN